MKTELIGKARQEWCEPPASETTLTHYGTKIIGTPKGSPCPPSVISALLEVLRQARLADTCPSCGVHRVYQCLKGCSVTEAEYVITRALEQKP